MEEPEDFEQTREIPTDPAEFENPEPLLTPAEEAQREAAAMAGDEEPGGTVAVPDHDSVDEWARALGVERSPDSPVRSSAEILDERDDRRRPHGASPDEERRSI